MVYATVFSAELEMTVALLVQIDKLVMLIESPIFTCKYILRIPLMIVSNIYPTKLSDFSSWSLRNTHTCSNACMGCSCYSRKAVHSCPLEIG
jgi:hypothetical protein